MSADDLSPPAEESPSPTPTTVRKHLPFALALTLGLGAGAASGALLVGPALANVIAPLPGAARAKAAAKERGEAAEKGEKAVRQTYTLDNLVLNPAESGGTRFLLLSVVFETTDAAAVEDMKARDAELREAVLVTLGAKTVDQLADMRTRDAFKDEIRRAALALLKTKAPLKVYFPQFVIQ